MESVITTASSLGSVCEMKSTVQSTAGYLGGTQFTVDLSGSMQSTSDAASTELTTPSMATFSQWYDEHVFEGVEYNPDAVQSLSLANISPKNFLSADEIQLEDSGFWTSSCDVSPVSSDVSRSVIGSGSGADASTCFSDISCDSHSDSMAVDDWADNFVQACFGSPTCQQQEITQSTSQDVISSLPPALVQHPSPDVATYRPYAFDQLSLERVVPSVAADDLRGADSHVADFPVIAYTQDATSDNGRFGADLQRLTPDDNKPATGDRTMTTSDKKPAMSYMTMIAMAILDAPQKRSLLNDIYEFVIRHFPYYERCKSAWRNSVRHNLSVNECFVKSGRAPSGRGFYWAIHPACLDDFKRGDFNRRQARSRAQTNFRLLKVYRQRAQVACSTHAAAQQDYYVCMRSTPTRQNDVCDSQPASQYYDETEHHGHYTGNYWC
ncbi:hypothetical protein LSAT2_030256 [Lamellibrachia satsuma]|nr:hypothetical protein LSAT2_030256 [Lamellibrachia satsuma]